MKSEMLVPLAVVIANVSGVAISVLVPAVLHPAEYSAFALAWSVGQFLAVLAFEWIRFPALRFSVGPDPALARVRSHAIRLGYRAVAVTVLALAAIALLLVPRGGIWAIAPFALLYAMCQGSFDGAQAFSRASRDNVAFARNWAVRALLSIALAVSVAWLSGRGNYAVIALSLSFPLTLGFAWLLKRRAPAAAPEEAANERRADFAWMARYGVMAAVSGVVAQGVPTVVRWAIVASYGATGAAGVLLAADISQKALLVTGLAVNVVAMQNSFRAVDTGDHDIITTESQRQVAWALAAVVPIGLLVYLLGGQAAAIALKPSYRAAFVSSIGATTLASALICVRLVAIDPLFYAFERSYLAVIGAAASLLCCALAFIPSGTAGQMLLPPLTVYIASAAIGLIVSTAIALVVLRVRVPWSQIARIAGAALVVVVVWRVLPAIGGIAGFLLSGTVLGLAYVAASAAFDVVWLRSMLLPQLLRRREA